jgi:hypothetical protein
MTEAITKEAAVGAKSLLFDNCFAVENRVTARGPHGRPKSAACDQERERESGAAWRSVRVSPARRPARTAGSPQSALPSLSGAIARKSHFQSHLPRRVLFACSPTNFSVDWSVLQTQKVMSETPQPPEEGIRRQLATRSRYAGQHKMQWAKSSVRRQKRRCARRCDFHHAQRASCNLRLVLRCRRPRQSSLHRQLRA